MMIFQKIYCRRLSLFTASRAQWARGEKPELRERMKEMRYKICKRKQVKVWYLLIEIFSQFRWNFIAIVSLKHHFISSRSVYEKLFNNILHELKHKFSLVCDSFSIPQIMVDIWYKTDAQKPVKWSSMNYPISVEA